MDKRTTLNEKLELLRHGNAEREQRYDNMVRALIDARAADGALKAGDLCPEFALATAEGDLITSTALLARGPLILSFYRGRWCPYCVTEVEALEEAREALADFDASIVAVTAETGGAALRLKREKAIGFEILCDPDNGLALAFGLVFRLPQPVIDAYVRGGIDFPVIYGNDRWMLSIPATYLIGQDGVIRHAHINPDFRERLDPQDIVRALRDAG